MQLIASKKLAIDPLKHDALRPASICLHLGSDLLTVRSHPSLIDPNDVATYPKQKKLSLSEHDTYVLSPGEFILGATVEKISLSNEILGHISNISGLARLGLNVVFSTHIAPGFGSLSPRPLTLEIHNASRTSLILRPNMRICHLLVSRVYPKATAGYDELFPNRYLGNGPSESEYY